MVPVSVRIDEKSKALWRELADKEGRSLGGYLERVLTWMKDRELLMEASALDVIADRLVTISNRLEEITLHNHKKTTKEHGSKERGSREILEQVLALELPSSLTSEAWKKWVLHLRMKKNNKLDVATAQAILERWTMAQDNGYDLEELVEIAIQRNTADAVYDSHIDQPKREGKRGSVDHASLFSSCVNG